MITYTFRLIEIFRENLVFECSKWDNYKEPVDVYTVMKRKRSYSCTCFARGNCKHIELTKEIIENGLEKQMHYYTWDYENNWLYAKDMEYA